MPTPIRNPKAPNTTLATALISCINFNAYMEPYDCFNLI